MADVGKKTGKQTQAGKDVYETPEGEMVSEKSTTFEYKGKWVNVPTIHNGKQYSDEELIKMLEKGLIKPTSIHNKLEEAIEAAESRSNSLEFNKGGAPMMEKQMELFEDGGLKDQGNTIDPMSGNSVPVGSTKKEVRDDIPAMLSEGEFVLPADVVRYVGLDKLMKLRQDAKMGLQKMNQMGQMGNSEEAVIPDNLPYNMISPMANQPLNTIQPQMKQGGVLQAQNGTFVPLSEQTPSKRQPDMIRKGGSSVMEGIELLVYINPETKDKINILVFNGVPQQKIPEGYILYEDYLKNLSEEELENEVIDTDPEITPETGGGSGGGGGGGDDPPKPEFVDYSKMNLDELKAAWHENQKARKIVTALGIVNPIIALFGRGATSHQRGRIEAEIKKQGGTIPEDEGFLADISSSISDFVSKVFGKDPEEVESIVKIQEKQDQNVTQQDVTNTTEDTSLAGSIDQAVNEGTPATEDTSLAGSIDQAVNEGTPATAPFVEVSPVDVDALLAKYINIGGPPSVQTTTTDETPTTVVDPTVEKADPKVTDPKIEDPVSVASVTRVPNTFDDKPTIQETIAQQQEDIKNQAKLRESSQGSQAVIKAAQEKAKETGNYQNVIDTINEAERIQDVIKAQQSGANIGFKKGGLASRKK